MGPTGRAGGDRGRPPCARARGQRIDTAPFYGWGRAEEILGRALVRRRDDVLLFTKCGTFRDGDNLRPESIRRDLEASLVRLRTDHVDLLQFHDPDPVTPIEESWGALHELVREGKVRHGGLSNHPPALVERALAVAPVAALQHQLSLLARDAERTFSRSPSATVWEC